MLEADLGSDSPWQQKTLEQLLVVQGPAGVTPSIWELQSAFHTVN